MTPRTRILELDGLRGLAIASVFIHHALLVPLLWIGVDLFFVLSGFLITGILLDRKSRGGSYFGHFYERRARRILVPYLMLLVLSSLLFGTQWMSHWYWYAFFGTNFASAFDQAGHVSLQPLWSLAVEEQFYLFWPFVVLLLPERLLLWVAAAMLFVAPLLRAVATPFFSTHFPIYFLTPFRMDLLCAGAVLTLLSRRYPAVLERAGVRAPWVCLASLVAFAAMTRFPGLHTGSNTVLSNVTIYSVALVLVTCLMLIALTRKGLFCRFLRNPVLRYVGLISYSMYLIHMTAIVLARDLTANSLAGFLIALAITLVYATVSWYGIEKRLLHPSTKVQTALANGTS